jgi:hypothetical protein
MGTGPGPPTMPAAQAAGSYHMESDHMSIKVTRSAPMAKEPAVCGNCGSLLGNAAKYIAMHEAWHEALSRLMLAP